MKQGIEVSGFSWHAVVSGEKAEGSNPAEFFETGFVDAPDNQGQSAAVARSGLSASSRRIAGAGPVQLKQGKMMANGSSERPG